MKNLVLLAAISSALAISPEASGQHSPAQGAVALDPWNVTASRIPTGGRVLWFWDNSPPPHMPPGYYPDVDGGSGAPVYQPHVCAALHAAGPVDGCNRALAQAGTPWPNFSYPYQHDVLAARRESPSHKVSHGAMIGADRF